MFLLSHFYFFLKYSYTLFFNTTQNLTYCQSSQTTTHILIMSIQQKAPHFTMSGLLCQVYVFCFCRVMAKNRTEYRIVIRPHISKLVNIQLLCNTFHKLSMPILFFIYLPLSYGECVIRSFGTRTFGPHRMLETSFVC